MLMRLALLTLIAAALLGAGAFARWRVHPSESGYAAVRKGVLLDQARTAPQGGVLLIGDSITERTPVDRLCGLPVFTAGISGAGISDIEGFAGKLAHIIKPRLTIVAIGVNDAQRDRPAPTASAFGDFDREVGGASYVLPLMPERSGQFGAAYFDPARIIRVRRAILSLGRPTVRPFDVAGHTIDGVHLDSAAKAVWRRRLQALCR